MANFDATEFGIGAVLMTNADGTMFEEAGTVLPSHGTQAQRVPDVLKLASSGAPGSGGEVDAGSWAWLG